MKKFIVSAAILVGQLGVAFHQSCIKDEGLLGEAKGQKVSDFDALDAATKGMRLSGMDIVVDKKNNVVGLQMKMTDTETAETVTLSPIGTMSPPNKGKVISQDLSKPVQILEASTSGSDGVRALKLVQDGNSKTWGSLSRDSFKLTFTEQQPLIGLYGYEENGKIMQLGFYSLDAECAATKPEEGMEPAEQETKTEETKSEETKKETEAEPEEDRTMIKLMVIAIFAILLIIIGIGTALAIHMNKNKNRVTMMNQE